MKGDPRCPAGVNYLDWLLNTVGALEMTADNIDDIIEHEQGIRAKFILDGTKPKRYKEGNVITLDMIGFKPKMKSDIKRRPLG